MGQRSVQPPGTVGGDECRARYGPRRWPALCIFGALLMLAVACRPRGEPVLCPIYFGQRCLPVAAPFCAYFQERGGVEAFGYPLTSVRVEGGLLVQYFEQVRMEYHPEARRGYKVQLGLLGDLLERREPPIPAAQVPPAFDSDCRFYAPTGHLLCEPFKGYYDAHGALDRFGYPISKPHESQEELSQDFQRGRLILREGGVSVADWGTRFMEQAPGR